MAQISLSVKLAAEDKTELNRICGNLGIPMATLINMFVKTVIRERRIPFEIREKRTNEMTEEEYLHSVPGLVDEIISRSKDEWIPYTNAVWEK